MTLGIAIRSLIALTFSACIALLTLQRATVPPPSAITDVINVPTIVAGQGLFIASTPQPAATTVPGHAVAATPTPRSRTFVPQQEVTLIPRVEGHIFYVMPGQNLAVIGGHRPRQDLTGDSVSVAPALTSDGSQLAFVRFMASYSDVLTTRVHYGAQGLIRIDQASYLTQDATPPGAPAGYDPRYYWWAMKPSWMPDGQHLLYLSDRPGFDSTDPTKADMAVFEQGVTDTVTNAVQLSTPVAGTGGADSPGWRPNDPAVFIYTDYYHDNTMPNGEGQIKAAMAVTETAPQGNPIALTPDRVTEFQPAWSPDGHYIAFAENKAGGHADLKVMAYHRPGALGDYYNAVTIQQGVPYAVQPFWSPDGRYLGYLANNGIGGDFEMYVRPVIYPRRKGDPLAFGLPVHLFQAGTVSADYRPAWGAQ